MGRMERSSRGRYLGGFFNPKIFDTVDINSTPIQYNR